MSHRSPGQLPVSPGIRPFAPGDEAAIADIYNHYILETTVTFEEAALPPEAMLERVRACTEQGHPWLVWQDDTGQVQGYAYAGRFHHRAAYRHTMEMTVYLRHGRQGQGMGRALYSAVLDHLRHTGCHVAMGVVALPNEPSAALHRSLGFQQVAHLHEVGHKFGRWIDVGFWELKLNPISETP